MLTGWGRTSPSPAHVIEATTVDDLAAGLDRVGPRGIIARGLGRSYGDPAQNAGGTVIDATAVTGIHHLDLERGVVTADAGTSLDQLMAWLVPLGWFVPVTPGTRQVTVGGAIASDIHGKDHHKVGSWCQAVEAITIVTPAEGRRRITADSDPELFWATAGGMGLTGIIVDATIKLRPIETSLLSVDTDRTADLDHTIEVMATGDHLYDYSVAWIDFSARGASMGRSIITQGQFATLDQLSTRQRRHPRAFRSGTIATFPRLVPNGLINRHTVRAFNQAWFHKAPVRGRGHIQTISQFFHPLDMVHEWNRVYGRRGLLQWQCAIPLEAVEELHAIVRQLSDSDASSFLAVLKRFGPGNPGPLSFPMEGWTLALDVPTTGIAGLGELLDRLDHQVADIGGRLYLAKDSRMDPGLLPAMYPRLDEWRKVREAVDPEGHLASDLGRRLGLIG